jgi:hypothetical protein
MIPGRRGLISVMRVCCLWLSFCFIPSRVITAIAEVVEDTCMFLHMSLSLSPVARCLGLL